jgi:glycosyltransferase involved in cell wall biosynthesis
LKESGHSLERAGPGERCYKARLAQNKADDTPTATGSQPRPARIALQIAPAPALAMTTPFVSVLMPVYNAATYLREAVESVLSQTHRDFELIAVDDASTDGSYELLQSYAARDPRVRALRQPQNLGIVLARNRAFREVSPRATYCAIIDADDVCLPDRLERQVAFLESHPDYALVGGHTLIIDAGSQVIGIRRYPTDYASICKTITRYNPIAQPAVMLRRSMLPSPEPYDPMFPRCQDYELWLRLAAAHPIANLDQPVLRYRISETQGKRTQLRQTLALTLQLQRRWLMYPRFRNAWNLAYVAAEHGLLLLPERFVLALFKRVTYSKLDAAASPG